MRSIFYSILVGSVLSAPTVFASEKVIPAWDGITENLMQTYIVDEGLRQLGYDVADPVQLQIQLAYVAMAKGDATFFAAYAEPIHDQYLKENGGDAVLTRLGHIAADSIQGYLIDKKTADATGVKYIEDFKDPEKAKLFDIDGNGKADLYGCEPGWGCEVIIEHHLDSYGLRDAVEEKQGGYFAIIPDAIERIKEGKPTLYYTWTPLWVSSILRPGKEVVFLNVKKAELPNGMTGNTTVDGLGNLGFPVMQQRIVATTSFVKENSSAKKLFELVQIPTEDLSAEDLRIYKGENSNDQVKQRALEWISTNKLKWAEWIAEAKAAN
ncbi:glycine betaine/L-proline ABC transporter substrate-binding protein ProX [Mesorhizobium loti]|uniref:Glycine betaine ABC transporter substrate-binding protein n=1 Tax=Rhizobium loti TaxID=381 RepID=A0A1A5QSL4_RHILI|nr:glycine betaine/L-proline ABC transporter substrate-binding protein ProX [Mesorhizobium loti]OBP78345.1 glycine betaine ABC transporter substrate-binding protein [Mesorhizobium loti]OBQ70272.1 glycine betaine ABC transporter substrate-binding protein [Mesorhizobium loti]QKC73198.1 proline/glycine betaine ABC transporter substrate-binding protein ProX [Mesorhizobium loti]